jgi:hypothetical protein
MVVVFVKPNSGEFGGIQGGARFLLPASYTSNSDFTD